MNIWIYIVGGLFALLGVVTFTRWIVNGWEALLKTASDLANTLRDATEIARAYREDLAILRQIAQSGPTPNFGNEPESIIPHQEQAGSRMPSPYWDRFAVKPEEPDAPLEPVSSVDLTPTDDDLMDQAKQEAAGDFEAQERQKARTREADQARLKELTNLSGEPEGK